MKRQQKDMKLIGDMAKGKKPFDAAKAAEAARDISVRKSSRALFVRRVSRPLLISPMT